MADEENPERGALERLLLAHLQEQRKARRWGVFFKSLGFVWLFILLFAVMSYEGETFTSTGPHTALVELNGEIGGESGMTADLLISALNGAFDDKHTQGVVMRINSPGGSPVQAGQVYAELRRLRAQHPDKPVYAVIGDVGASGAYYIAAGAQEIYADRASLVGSIGVRMDGFGFVEAMQRLGIERRLLTSGANKGLLDPFSPVQPAQLAHVQTLLDAIHQQFIAAVREGRGERLHETPEIFSGLFWTGEQAQALGLVDGYGSVESIARDKLGTTQIRDHTQQEKPFERLFGQVESTLAGALTRAFGLDSPLR